MKILGLDSALEKSSVALADGGRVLGETSASMPREQLTWLIPAASDLLERLGIGFCDLEGIAVTSGPGSFTGLRLGLSTARTLAQVLSIPIAGFRTLDVIAQNAKGAAPLICPVIDARKGEIFCALFSYSGKVLEKRTEDLALKPEDLLKKLSSWIREGPVAILGNALQRYGEIIREGTLPGTVFPGEETWYPRASVLALMGEELISSGRGIPALELDAWYLRRPEAVVTWEKKHEP